MPLRDTDYLHLELHAETEICTTNQEKPFAQSDEIKNIAIIKNDLNPFC